IIVSTHTISLQEQLIHKDIPFLQAALPQPFSAVLVKGRSNYISLRRLRGALSKMGTLLGNDDEGILQLQQIGKWAKKTSDGSRSDLNFRPLSSVWELVESDSGNCLGRNCPDYNQCFYFKARKQIYSAQVLVVNHALFFTDLALRGAGAGFLPDYQVVIFDEAHTLEDVAAEHLGIQVTSGAVEYLLNRLYNPRNAKGLLPVYDSAEALQQANVARSTAGRLFPTIRGWAPRQSQAPPGGGRA